MALPADTEYLCKTCQGSEEQELEDGQPKSHAERSALTSPSPTVHLREKLAATREQSKMPTVATGAMGNGMDRFEGRRTFFPIS